MVSVNLTILLLILARINPCDNKWLISVLNSPFWAFTIGAKIIILESWGNDKIWSTIFWGVCLEIAEEQIFRLYAQFQNVNFDGEINYPDSFNIRDYASDLMFFQQAKASGVDSATLTKEIDKEIARAVVDNDEKLNEIFEEIDFRPAVFKTLEFNLDQQRSAEDDPFGF